VVRSFGSVLGKPAEIRETLGKSTRCREPAQQYDAGARKIRDLMPFFSHKHFWFYVISAASISQFKGNGHLIPLFDGFSIDGGWVEVPGFYGVNRCLIQTRKTTRRFYFDVPSRAVTLDLNA
jgi:hypothetical protein